MVSKEMVGYVSSAYKKYSMDLEKKREEDSKKKKAEKRKSAMEDLESLTKKIWRKNFQ